MDWVRCRLRAGRSILDLDPAVIQKRLARLGEGFRTTLIDNRAADALFVTVLVAAPEWTEATWRRVQRVLLRLPKMRAFVADEHGAETPVESVEVGELPRFTVQWQEV